MAEVNKAIGLLCCLFFLLLICFFIPISMIIIGARYKDECPVERMIPIWLIVSGVLAFFQCIFAPAFQNYGKSERSLLQFLGLVVNVFQLIWFVCGSVWIYGKYEPNYNIVNESYCHKTVYIFSFWIQNVTYAVFLFTLLVAGLLLLFNSGLND